MPPPVLSGYGEGGFRVSGEFLTGSILLLPDRAAPWSAASLADASIENLASVFTAEPRPELLLIGCGRQIMFAPPALRAAIKGQGLALEVLDTGAACRTYNVLLAEGRRVAAALIALG